MGSIFFSFGIDKLYMYLYNRYCSWYTFSNLIFLIFILHMT
ncbi:hypothetical protein [Enterococcus phage PEF1]